MCCRCAEGGVGNTCVERESGCVKLMMGFRAYNVHPVPRCAFFPGDLSIHRDRYSDFSQQENVCIVVFE